MERAEREADTQLLNDIVRPKRHDELGIEGKIQSVLDYPVNIAIDALSSVLSPLTGVARATAGALAEKAIGPKFNVGPIRDIPTKDTVGNIVSGIIPLGPKANEFLQAVHTGEEAPTAFHAGRKLDEQLNLLTQNHYRRGIEATQALSAAPKDVPMETWEKLYHWEETPDKVSLTPEERALYDRYVKPLADRHNDLYRQAGELGLTKADLADLTPGKIGDLGYTPRFVKGKPSLLSRVVEQGRQAFGGRTLSKQAGSLKARTATGSTAEIEAQAGKDLYYKHVLVNRAAANVELERAVENARFLKSRIPELESDGFLAKPGARDVPKNWRESKIPQLKGYKMEPSVADAFDDFWGKFHRDHTPVGEALARINDRIGGIIFMLPVRHILNVADTWAVAKGASSLVNPRAYARLPRTFARAVDEVRKQGPIYRAILEKGGALQTARDGMSNLHGIMLKKMGAEVAANPTLYARIAKAAGYANPMAWARRLIAGSEDHHVLWAAGDMLYTQHVISLMDRGISMEEAIAETEKSIPSYRVPSRVYNGPGGRVLAQIYKDPNITFFGRYRYSLLNSYASHISDLVRPMKAGDRAKAADRLLMVGLLGLVGYPLLDTAVRKATGNKNASVVRPGLSALPYDIYLATQGEKNATDLLTSLITPAPGVPETLQLLYNHDLFSGRPIYDPQRPGAAATQIIGREAGQAGAFKAGQRIYEGKTDFRRILEQQFGINDPTPQQVALAKKYRLQDSKRWQKMEAKDWERMRAMLRKVGL